MRSPRHFRLPPPDGRPRGPTDSALPHSFSRALPTREAFVHGAGPPISSPRTEPPSSTTKGGGRRAALFAFRRSYIIYIRARGTLFVHSAGGGRCALRRENGKAVENARGGEQFLHRVDKPVENKLWISGNRCAFSTAPPRTEAKRWTRSELRAQRRESAARSAENSYTRGRKQALKREKRRPCARKSPHTGTETQHPTANTRLLRTGKGAARRKRPRESPKTVAPLAR